MKYIKGCFAVVFGGLLALAMFIGVIWLGRQVFAPSPEVAAPPAGVNPPAAVDAVPETGTKPNPRASDCKARATKLGAPNVMVSAICNATPLGNGVSGRLPSGTYVAIGSITFDAQDTVWFLEGFTTPAMANYAFEYKGAERAIFDAPFVVGSELGYGKDGTRVPFKICWDVTSEGCVPPTDLFPGQ